MWKSRPLVYLSGGISGKTYEDGNIWREHATELLLDAGISVANPLRDHYYKGECGADNIVYSLSEICGRDLMDLKYADALLAELTCPDINYFGTTSEIVIAHREYDTPIIVWAGSEERKKKLEYSWIARWATAIIVDLDDAIDHVINLFNYEEPWQNAMKKTIWRHDFKDIPKLEDMLGNITIQNTGNFTGGFVGKTECIAYDEPSDWEEDD